MTDKLKTFDFKEEKAQQLKDMKFALFVSVYEQAHDIEKLQAKRIEKECEIIDNKFAEAKATLDLLDAKVKGKRVSEQDKAARMKAFGTCQTLAVQKNGLLVAQNEAYKKIAQRAQTIQGYCDIIAFLEKFGGSIPKLAYLEVDNTRYASNELGGYQKDEAGNKVLYLEPAAVKSSRNDKSNNTKKN